MIKNDMYFNQVVDYTNKNKDLLLKLENKTILITGAAGLIGSYFVDIIMNYNIINKGNIKIIAVDKNKERSTERFESYLKYKNFEMVVHDVNIYIKTIIKLITLYVQQVIHLRPTMQNIQLIL